MIGPIVYFLCAITSSLCAFALSLQYRRNRVRMLLWSALCFTGLAVNNFLLLLDFYTPNVDLSVPRIVPGLLGIAIMVWAFIRETV